MMRYHRVALVLFAAIALCSVTVLAAEEQVGLVELGVTVDGDLSDPSWKAAVWYEFSEDTAYAENGGFKGFSGKFAVLKQGEYLYFAFDAEDDVLMNSRSGGDLWQDDCVEVWFNFGGQASAPHEKGYWQLGLAPTSASGEAALAIWRTAPGEDIKAWDNIKVASKQTDDGWTVEASMHLPSMNAYPLPDGTTFNVSVVDRDVAGAGGDANWNHLTWHGQNHSDPSYFVPLVLE